MPQGALAIAGIGSAIGGVGSMFSQSAANQMPRSLFPGATSFLASLFGGSGTGGNNPGGMLGGSLASTLGSLISTGNPTNVGPAWQSMVQANQQLTSQGLSNLMTQFAGGGARYSSAAMGAGANYTQQSNQNFMSILANYTMQAQEAAAQRQLAAVNMGMGALQNLGTTFTNPTGSVAGAGLSSAGSSLQLISLLKALNA